MLYKTHQTEHQYKVTPEHVKTSSVRSGQTLPLRQLVQNAQRGLLPDSVTFSKGSNGFIPPQYDRSHLAERFNRMKEIALELETMRKPNEVRSDPEPAPPSPTPEGDKPQE